MSSKGLRFPAEILSTEQVLALLAACSERPAGLRFRALLVLLWRGGLRISEALAVRPRDVDYDRGIVRVVRGKGGYPRRVALDGRALEVILRWHRARPVRFSDQVPLLCSRRGVPLSTAYCREEIKRLAGLAGIRARVHCHGLRHTYAVQALRAGVPLPTVQAQLGHQSMATTGIYLRHVTDDDLLRGTRNDW